MTARIFIRGDATRRLRPVADVLARVSSSGFTKHRSSSPTRATAARTPPPRRDENEMRRRRHRLHHRPCRRSHDDAAGLGSALDARADVGRGGAGRDRRRRAGVERARARRVPGKKKRRQAKDNPPTKPKSSPRRRRRRANAAAAAPPQRRASISLADRRPARQAARTGPRRTRRRARRPQSARRRTGHRGGGSLEDRVAALDARAHAALLARCRSICPIPTGWWSTVEFELNRNGTLSGQPRVTTRRRELHVRSAHAHGGRQRALRAVRACDPYPFPNDPVVGEHYDLWRSGQFVFGIEHSDFSAPPAIRMSDAPEDAPQRMTC